MDYNDKKIIEDLLETTKTVIETNNKVHANIETQDQNIAKLIDSSKQLIDNNNRLSEFCKQQNLANKAFMIKIATLEGFVFFLLAWEFYKAVIA